MRKTLLSILLTTIGWAGAPALLLGALLALDAAVEALGSESSFANKGSAVLVMLSVGWTLSGLSLALVLRAWLPAFSWKRVFLTALLWGLLLAGATALGFAPAVIFTRGAHEMSFVLLFGFFALVCAPPAWGVAGAIGGGTTMYLLRAPAPALQRKDAAVAALGWGLGFLLGGVLGALAAPVAIFTRRAVLAMPFLFGVAGGVLGGSAMFWRLGRLPAQPEIPGDADESLAQPAHTERTLTRGCIGLTVAAALGAGLVLAVVTASHALPRVPAEERAALRAFYAATGGEEWQDAAGWMSWQSPCRWRGVYCRDAESRWFRSGGSLLATMHVGSLILNRNGLTGDIPPELSDLPYLKILDLNGNRLTGSIPPELGRLDHLEQLRLAENALTGDIPPELGALVNLTDLRLEDNRLTGSIPPAWGALANLAQLRLSSNQLSGQIPPELSALANLETLLLDHNQLSGPLPPELGALASLEKLDLGNNQLSGPLPSELAALQNLKYLHLNYNQLDGSVPPEWGGFPHLYWLYLDHNPLSGALPIELSDLPKATKIYFDHTDLCEPADPAFQEWLAGLRETGRTGILCQ